MNRNRFTSYLTNYYSKDDDANHNEINHQCKMGFVSVFDENGELDQFIGKKVLELIRFTNN
jgi:5-methylcytosine-specific restriction enzyme subunit McrC